jgi:DNA-binding MarR family transcriptional regulator
MAKPRNRPRSDFRDPLTDPLAVRLGYQLRRVSVLMMADLVAQLAPTGLRPAEITILLLVGANPGCRQGEVGEALGIKRANMVPLVARLVDSGLVARAHADGRSHALSLTVKGNTRVAAIKMLLDQHEAEFRSRLSAGELAGLLKSLSKLRGETR